MKQMGVANSAREMVDQNFFERQSTLSSLQFLAHLLGPLPVGALAIDGVALSFQGSAVRGMICRIAASMNLINGPPGGPLRFLL